MEFHVAQLNVAKLRAPLDSSQLSEFVANLEPINALADASPGFVWRLQTEAGDATSIRAFDDDMIIVNLSVWESLETMRAFVYASAHKAYLGRKAEWFEPAGEAHLAVWWIPSGTVPTVQEALGRLHDLRTDGPTERAFTLKTAFPGAVQRRRRVAAPTSIRKSITAGQRDERDRGRAGNGITA